MNNVQPGGVILLGHNISTYDGTINYVNELKKNSKIPLIVSIDQEGGCVQRLKYLEDIDKWRFVWLLLINLQIKQKKH